MKIENEDYNSKLTLAETKRKHTGTYTLRAENESGFDEASVEVIILDKPGKPEGPLEVSNVHKEGCKLKWDKPKDDGGLPITGYVVEKQDVSTGRWVPAGFVDADKTDLELTGLEPNKKYNFRVKAVNEEGESEPLETDTATLAKNPYDVSAPPGLPEIVDWDEHSVKLKWEKPVRDGGTPIIGYVIEAMDKFTGQFVKVAEVGPQCQGTVSKLEEGNQYKFRVRAINKAGLSEPSEQTNWHTAKARFCKFRQITIIFIDLMTLFFSETTHRSHQLETANCKIGPFNQSGCKHSRRATAESHLVIQWKRIGIYRGDSHR